MIRVLLVDDEDSFRLSVEMALKMTDQFSVRSCNSGESAVELLKKDQFDVILLDNKMEDMSGLEVLQVDAQPGNSDAGDHDHCGGIGGGSG